MRRRTFHFVNLRRNLLHGNWYPSYSKAEELHYTNESQTHQEFAELRVLMPHGLHTSQTLKIR
jgi:hypothetical protein